MVHNNLSLSLLPLLVIHSHLLAHICNTHKTVKTPTPCSIGGGEDEARRGTHDIPARSSSSSS
jgi:hypothetical protein